MKVPTAFLKEGFEGEETGQLACAQCEPWTSQSKWVLPWGSGEEGSGPAPFLTDSLLSDLAVVEHTEGMQRV